ncbi:hypothetical protein C8R43DRAFT_1097267, partial [Mycena crocata]
MLSSTSLGGLEWPAMACVKHDIITDRAWSHSQFMARPLSAPWPGKEQPIMAINSSRLLVAAGTILYSYLFGVSNSEEAPPITLEGSFSLAARRDRCITALAYIPDGGLDQTFFVGFQDGTCERIVLAGRSKHNYITTLHVQRSTGRPLQPPHKDLLESLSSLPAAAPPPNANHMYFPITLLAIICTPQSKYIVFALLSFHVRAFFRLPLS